VRTTIDLPDDLFRRMKAKAALEGLSLKQLITAFVERGLQERDGGRPAPSRRSSPPIITKANTGRPIPALSNADLARIEEEEDLAAHHRSVGR
jgi:hypothetical protein